MKVADVRKRLSSAINQAEPTLPQVLDYLEDQLTCDVSSQAETDGVIRDAERGRDILCLAKALEVLRTVAWPPAPAPDGAARSEGSQEGAPVVSNAEDEARYRDAMHAVQSGIASEIDISGLNAAAADPKHLRVGVNSAMVSNAAIGRLLVAKGIFTNDELRAMLAAEAEREKASYEERLSKLLGKKVTLA